MERTDLFRLEVGILLGKDHEEFENYNKVYTKDFGFYDEDVTFYLDYEKTAKDAKDYVKSGTNGTYAVITSTLVKLTEEEKKEINDTGSYRHLNVCSRNENDILYFCYQENNGNIKTVVDKKS